MNKRNKILCASAALALSVTGISLVLAGNKSLAARTMGDGDEWTITLGPSDLVPGEDSTENDYHTDWATREVGVKTDQNKNDVTLSYVNGRYRYFNRSYFELKGDEEGYLYNVTPIRSMKYLEVFGYRGFYIEWGWSDGVSVDYLNKEYVYCDGSGSTETIYFNNEMPNYFRITAGNYTEFALTSLKIGMDRSCVESENPYVTKNGIRYIDKGDHFLVAGYDDEPFNDVVLETEINGKPVTEIGENAFEYSNVLKTINLDNITKIGQYAFSNCEKLSSIGNFLALEEIDYNAFFGCYALRVPGTFGSNLEYIGGNAFNSAGLTSVTIPDGANVEMGHAAFRFMSDLESVSLGDSVQYTDDFLYDNNLAAITVSEDNPKYKAFDNVLYKKMPGDKLALFRMAPNRPQTSYVMPEEVDRIEGYACQGGSTLESVVLNDDVEKIADNTFYGCSSLRDFTFGAKTAWIGSYAFQECAFESLVIPGTVKQIDSSAFRWCESLRSVTIEEGVEILGEGAFRNCHALSYVLLPESLTEVGTDHGFGETGDVFDDCPNLKKVFTNLPNGHYETEAEGWYGSRQLLYFGEGWDYAGEDGAPRIISDHITIQSSGVYSADGAWFAVWAWTKGSDNGMFLYDHNAPVDYKYTIEVLDGYNCFIVLRMASGVDAGSISGFPEDGQIWNRSGNMVNVPLDEFQIDGWDDGFGNLLIHYN